MPWCPNCKAEYQEGYTVCSDCKTELVDDIKEAEVLVPFFQADDKKVAEKLVKFFHYSDVNASYEYNEENEVYVVSISPKKQMEAKKLYQAFYFVERERLMTGESDLLDTEEADEAPADSIATDSSPSEESEDGYEYVSVPDELNEEDNYDQDTPSDEITAFDDEEVEELGVYVMKADQYKDLTGTVGVFLFFGVVGIVFVILNLIGTLSFLNGWIPILVMSALFLSFLYIALSTHQKAKKIQVEINAENELTEKINTWLKQNVTESFLSSLHNEDISDELNYMKKTDKIKEMLLSDFGPQNLSYLDRLIEEFYTQTYGY